MDPAHDRRDVHAPLGHQGDEIAIAQGVGKVTANTALDHFTRESPNGTLRAKAAGYHEPAANAPEPPEIVR